MSQRHLVKTLQARGFKIAQRTVRPLLKDLGYSLQANAKTKEGANHPDGNAQFEHINALVKAFRNEGQPAISVDTKKKELVGNFKNNERTLCPKGKPEPVRVHDFIIKDKEHGRVSPYGVYDIAATKAGSMSASIMTRQPSPSKVSGAGGTSSAKNAMPTRQNACSSLPIAAAATVPVSVYGRSSCKNWPMKPACPSRSPIIPLAPASRTASSTVCSLTSV